METLCKNQWQHSQAHSVSTHPSSEMHFEVYAFNKAKLIKTVSQGTWQTINRMWSCCLFETFW